MTRKIRGRFLLTGPSTWTSTAADNRIYGAIYQPIQSLTLSTAALGVSGPGLVTSTQATVRPDGVTVITSTGTGSTEWKVRLDQPTYPGMRKTIVTNCNSAVGVELYTHTSGVPIDGDGANNVATFSSGASARLLELIATSTVRWEALNIGLDSTEAAVVTFSSAATPAF